MSAYVDELGVNWTIEQSPYGWSANVDAHQLARPWFKNLGYAATSLSADTRENVIDKLEEIVNRAWLRAEREQGPTKFRQPGYTSSGSLIPWLALAWAFSKKRKRR